MSNSDAWTVHDPERDNTRTFNTRSDAESAREDMKSMGIAVDVYPPGESPTDDGEADGGEFTPGDDGTPAAAAADPVVEDTDDKAIVDAQPDDLPDRSVADDPLTWMPGHFIDQIDGTPAINRKGFEVLAHHYDISTTSDLEVPPEETGHEYVRVKATATTPDGRTCDAYGSAHVNRGDDPDLLLEMADTRARKRALSIATGVGVVAVEELRNEVDR